MELLGVWAGLLPATLQPQEGQDAIKKFLALPEGIALLQNFAGTFEGKKTMSGILPQVPGGLNLPPGVADTIMSAFSGQQ